MTNLRYFGQDDLERLEEIKEAESAHQWGTGLLARFLVGSVVALVFVLFFWAMSIRPT